MDELAYALKMDPVKLRLVNDTQNEPIKGLPFTSRSLAQCFDAAAERFGWSTRDPWPGSMRDGDWQVGWGTAATMYPSNIAVCAARVTHYADGTARVQVATHEIWQGSIGELGNVGMSAAVANAVFHATGIRVRHFPIRLEELLAMPSA